MHEAQSATERQSPGSLFVQFKRFALIAVLVFCAAFFSTITRSIGALSIFWPANAILLGLLIRDPRRAVPWGWLSAAVAFIAVDLLAGRSLAMTLWLAAANLTGVFIGFLLFRRLSEDDRRIRRPESVLHIFAICIAAAIAAALVGAGTVPFLFHRSLATGFFFWFTTELGNNILVLPVVLTAPNGLGAIWSERRSSERRSEIPQERSLKPSLPLLAFLASIALAVAVGGPGAIAIPVPALLWCALSYSLFSTVSLMLPFSIWQIYTASLGSSLLFLPGDPLKQSMSIHIGIALLALGPLTVASTNAAKNELLQRLDYAASYDFLTGALARGAFINRGNTLLTSSSSRKSSATVLMLDIDHFKSVNDLHGHSAGDQILAAFAREIKSTLRSQDIFGRLGGEEFAVILPGLTLPESREIAERIRRKVEAGYFLIHEATVVNITVSIGMAYQEGSSNQSLDSVLSISDRALYTAKTSGRNKVMYAEDASSAN